MKRSLVLFVFCIVFFAACGSSSSYSPPPPPSQPTSPPKWAGITLNGEEEPLLEGTIWIESGSTDTFWNTYEFRFGGRLIHKRFVSGYGHLPDIYRTWTHTWNREGNTVRMIGENGESFWEGRYYPQTQRIMLTSEDSEGHTYDHTWEPK